MIAYCGQTRSADLIAELEQLGIGECTQRGEIPPRRTRWFYDNHAFADWRAGRDFNGVRWLRDQWRIEFWTTGSTPTTPKITRPDFVVVPDIVCGGEASLAFSAQYRPDVPAWCPAYLVVQNGMSMQRVRRWLARQPLPYHGIFVGGDLPWKLDTSAAWVKFAHDRGMKCHIGRCGPPGRVRWARAIGADSIDSCLPLRARPKMDAFLDALGVAREAA